MPAFQYAGYYVHGRSGLNLTVTRAYSAGLGRFISRDPIEEAGGVNLYDYVDNEPVHSTDPSGTQCIVCGGWPPNKGKQCGGKGLPFTPRALGIVPPNDPAPNRPSGSGAGTPPIVEPVLPPVIVEPPVIGVPRIGRPFHSQTHEDCYACCAAWNTYEVGRCWQLYRKEPDKLQKCLDAAALAHEECLLSCDRNPDSCQGTPPGF